jgi:cytochrome c553
VRIHDNKNERIAMQRSLKSLLLIAAVAASASYCAGAVAQTAEAMRTLNASPMDIADGKHVAEIGCAACHNLNGISTVKGTPHIAGQRPAYLYLTLKEYKSGVRTSEAMTSAIKFLSDDALIKVAAYFASLDPAPVPAGPAGPAKPDPVEAGKAASAACAGCHGNAGVSQIPGIPSLIGLDPKYMVDAMKAYKNGQRKNDTMKAMLASVNEATMSNVALFYALQKPERAKTPAAGDAAAGKAASASCGGCHGEDGVSSSPATPSLAGQDAQFLAAALLEYKDGSRVNDTMKGLAASLDDKAMKNLAAYFASQTPKAPNVRKPLSTAEWVERCNRCHGVNGNSTDPRFPMLASQRVEYLQKALLDYKAQTRKSTEMHAMAGGLSENDIDNLAAFYAHEKARAVLFVPLSK